MAQPGAARAARNERPDPRMLSRTLIVAALLGVVAFAVLIFQLYNIMIKNHSRYEEMAIAQQTKETRVAANRGTIYDANGNALAISATAYNVFISPYELSFYGEDPEFVAKGLEEILGVDAQSVLEKFKDTKSWYKTIVTRIEPDLADRVRQFKADYKGRDKDGKEYKGLRSVHLEMDSKRYYPYGSLCCHVLGFVGTDNYGLDGIEMVYNKYLQGTDGSVIRLTANNGVELLYENYENYNAAVDGCDVHTTLDVNIQGILEKNLDLAMEANQIEGNGCVIAMDPNTGAILGLANAFRYDNNNPWALSEKVQAELDLIADETEYRARRAEEQRKQWRNMAVSDTYEPGSVFKTITLSMALEEGIFNESDHFYCSGSLAPELIPGRTTPLNCWKRSGHGDQTLRETLMHSCNVAFANMAMTIGADIFYDYVEAYGFWSKTGIDLPGETSTRGLWWSDKVFKDPKNKSQLAAASFGQTANVTPIQMITAVCAAVNGGHLMEPYVVSEIVAPDGTVKYAKEPTEKRQVISEETSKLVASMLESVVGDEGGTGKSSYVAGYHVGGKTGTTTDTAYEAATGIREYMVSFCGVAPASDPQIAIIMVLNRPNKDSGIYIGGGVMTGTYVGSIFSEIMPYLGVEPDYNEVEKTYLDASVPKIIGDSLRDAKEKMLNRGFEIRIEGDGQVVTDQVPAANSVVAAGSRIVIYTGGERRTEPVTVPNITGMTFQRARAELAKFGLYMTTSGALPTDNAVVVQWQSIAAGEPAHYGAVLRVVLADKNTLGFY